MKIRGTIDFLGAEGGSNVPGGDYTIDVGGNIVLETNGERPIINSSGIATLLDLEEPVDARAVTGQIDPAVGNSGIYLGPEEPFSQLYASGVSFVPLNDNIPQVGYHREDTREGDLWHREASVDVGPGFLAHDTGSGIANCRSGSGIFFAYSSVGGSGVPNFPTYGLVPFNQTSVTDGFFQHDGDDEKTNTYLWFNVPGLYRIAYSITLTNTSADRTTSQVLLIYNNSVFIAGANSYGYHRTSSNGGITTFGTEIYREMKAGDRIHVSVTEFAGGTALETVANASNLRAEFIRPPANQFH